MTGFQVLSSGHEGAHVQASGRCLLTMPWLLCPPPLVVISSPILVFIPWRTEGHPQGRCVSNSSAIVLSLYVSTSFKAGFGASTTRPPGYLSDWDFLAQFWGVREDVSQRVWASGNRMCSILRVITQPIGVVNGNETDEVTQQRCVWLAEECFSYLDKHFATLSWVKTNFL